MLMKRNAMKKRLISEFKEFSQAYMQRLGKRKVRDYINEFEQ